MKKISVLVPIFNEEENIKPLYEMLKSLFLKILNKYEYEIIFLDNNSDDNSRNICLEIKKNDNQVIYIKQSRNFGYQANILMGYHNCSGDCAIVIDADGQDDPNLIESLIQKWEKGYDVVYGIRKDRDENFIIKNIRKIFYRFLNLLSNINIPADAGDFRLVSRKIIDNIKLIQERSVYLRGLISYLGFKQIGIEYNRKRRTAGKSKFSLFKNYELAERGILSFTKVPLQLITLTGFFVFLLSIFGIFFYLWLYIFKGVAVEGFTTIILLFLFFFGLMIFFLGIMALYIGLILDEVKKRPIFIVDEKK
jgi:dolichol-phosphate mannosyltransferase